MLVAVGNGGRYCPQWRRRLTTQVLLVGEVGNKLVDVAFFHGRFWIVGEMGALSRPDADGANWTKRLRDADDAAFNRIRPGPRGSVDRRRIRPFTHSEDDGASWLSQDLGEESLQSIVFGDDGVVVGNRGQAFHTTDGGSRWQPVAPFTSGNTCNDVLAQAAAGLRSATAACCLERAAPRAGVRWLTASAGLPRNAWSRRATETSRSAAHRTAGG